MTARLALLAPLAYLAIFFLYPLGAIFERAFIQGEGGLSAFGSLLGDSYYLGRIWFTTWQAAASTALTLVVGLPMAYLFARHDFPGKSVLKAVSTVPFIMPTIVVAMGFVALLGREGLLNTLLTTLFGFDEPPVRIANSIWIILLAHAFYNYAIFVRIVSAFWSNVAPQLEESAAMLGASRVRTFWHVTLPVLLPAIASSSALTFAFCFTSFGVVLVLGGPQFATLEVAVYELTAKLLRLELASALAIIQMVFTYLFLLVYTRLQQGTAAPLNLAPQEATARRPKRLGDVVFVVAMIALLLVVLSPLWALVERALSGADGYTLKHFGSLLENVRGDIFYLPLPNIISNSVRFAVVTTAIALGIGAAAAYFISRPGRRGASVADALLMMPLGVSAVIMGFGFLVAFNRDPIDLRATAIILVIAHTLVAYPFVIRSVLPAMRGMPQQLREAASVMGATPVRAFYHVELPILTPALIVGATFAFAVSMGEFGASLLLVRPESTTMPVAVYRMLSQPGAENLGRALAMSTVLMLVVAVVFAAIERFRYRNAGGF
jgi:thiamine transport system permease protein